MIAYPWALVICALSEEVHGVKLDLGAYAETPLTEAQHRIFIDALLANNYLHTPQVGCGYFRVPDHHYGIAYMKDNDYPDSFLWWFFE